MKYTLFFLFACILTLAGCSTKYTVVKVSPENKEMKSQGFMYSLPKNVLHVNVHATKTRQIEGPYAMYAQKYLGIRNVIKRSSTSYAIEHIDLTIQAIADPSETFFINIPKCIKKKNQLSVQFTPEGMLTSVNTCNKHKGGELHGKKPNQDGRHTPMDEKNAEAEQLLSYGKNLQETYDTIIERVLLDSMTIEKKILKKIMIEKTPEQKAKETADQILKIRDERFKLFTGYAEIAYTEGAIAYMDKGLEKMENEYMRMYTGMSYSTTQERAYTFTPTALLYDSLIPLFRFSKEQGVLDTSFYSGTPVFIKFEKVAQSTDADSLLIYRNKNIKKKGVCYRVPQPVRVTLIHEDEVIASDVLPIAQLGQTTFLPPKQLTMRIDPRTGILRFVKIER